MIAFIGCKRSRLMDQEQALPNFQTDVQTGVVLFENSSSQVEKRSGKATMVYSWRPMEVSSRSAAQRSLSTRFISTSSPFRIRNVPDLEVGRNLVMAILEDIGTRAK